MSDETRAVPSSADIEAIRQRNERARALIGKLCTREEKWRMSVPVDMERDSDMVLDAALMDTDALLAALDGERRQRADLEHQNAALSQDAEGRYHQIADLERQLEEARELLGYVALRFRQSLARTPIKDATECLASVDAFLARQVVQEAETPC